MEITSINFQKTQSLGRKNARLAFLLALPAIILIALVVAYPIGFSVVKSFTTREGYSLKNYKSILSDNSFSFTLLNTIKFTLIIVIIELVIGLIVALCLQNIKIRNSFRALFTIPLLVSPVVSSYAWMWLLNDQYGLISHILKFMKITPPLWLANPNWAFISIVIVDMWIATPFVIIVFQSALASLPKSPYESAEIDGASSIQKFRYLTLPFLKPAFLVILTIRTMDVFRIYDSIVVLTGGGPGNATMSLSLLAFRTGITFGNLKGGSAMSLLMTIPLFIATIICIRAIFKDEI